MLVKFIFLVLLCIPIAYLNLLLLLNTIQDLKPRKRRRTVRRASQSVYEHEQNYFSSDYLKSAR